MPLSIEERLRRGPATSNELQNACGMNQVAVSRALRSLGGRVVSRRRGRTPVYALTRSAFGADDRLPLWQVDPHGNFVRIGFLRPLAHGGFFVEGEAGLPEVLLGEAGDGWYDDLPYFLEDLRPQGFLGRQVAGELARRSPEFSSDPRQWSAEQVGSYLVANGDDLPGNLLLGRQVQWRVRQPPATVTETDYLGLAESVMSGVIPGSSAGGEQPKFTACHAERGPVIVKFSPPGDDPVAVRWRDILVTEHHAADAIRAADLPAAETRLIAGGGRLFLESRRFDRTGPLGRLSAISLAAVDAEFVGLGASWPRVMEGLFDRGLATRQHLFYVQVLSRFGELIHNTDMHLGNLSLGIEGKAFRLLPAYDVCSMGLAPRAGEVPPFLPRTPTMPAARPTVETHAQRMVADFRARLVADPRASAGLRGVFAE